MLTYCKLRHLSTQTNWNFSRLSHDASEIRDRGARENMIYFDLEKQFSRAWYGDTRRSTGSCATFVLHLFSRERECHDESSRGVPPSFPSLIPGESRHAERVSYAATVQISQATYTTKRYIGVSFWINPVYNERDATMPQFLRQQIKINVETYNFEKKLKLKPKEKLVKINNTL